MDLRMRHTECFIKVRFGKLTREKHGLYCFVPPTKIKYMNQTFLSYDLCRQSIIDFKKWWNCFGNEKKTIIKVREWVSNKIIKIKSTS